MGIGLGLSFWGSTQGLKLEFRGLGLRDKGFGFRFRDKGLGFRSRAF